jgi:hypothetical protein
MILLPLAIKCALIFHGRDRMCTQVISEEIYTSLNTKRFKLLSSVENSTFCQKIKKFCAKCSHNAHLTSILKTHTLYRKIRTEVGILVNIPGCIPCKLYAEDTPDIYP